MGITWQDQQIRIWVSEEANQGGEKNCCSKKNKQPNYQGTWRWDARCPLSGRWTGTFILHGQPANLLGKFTMDQPGGDGTFLGGSIMGSRIVISRKTGLLNQTWDGHISGSGTKAIITGIASHALESCPFSARK